MTALLDTPTDTPNVSRPSTPRLPLNFSKGKASARGNKATPYEQKMVVSYDLDIDPDDLEPEYVSAKAQLLELSRNSKASDADGHVRMEIAKLEGKVRKIENDVLFDKFSAEQKWKSERIIIEKQLAAAKKEAHARVQTEHEPEEAEAHPKPKEDDVNKEAERIAAEILSQQDHDDGDDDDDDDDYNIDGLFTSLPQDEIDSDTGKTRTVINSAGGNRLVIRDFGKWTGASPRRILEEACRLRYRLLFSYSHSGASD